MKNTNEKKELEQINSELRKGDQKLIAEMCECTSDYVKMVLDPENPRKSEKVIKAAKKVIKNRKSLLEGSKK